MATRRRGCVDTVLQPRVAMKNKPLKAASLVLCAALGLQVAGCGTLLYPARRGHVGAHIDVGVAVMDGVWCLAFLIPGVVAYIVDFSNGSIYE
jgi:hypothetical protein